MKSFKNLVFVFLFVPSLICSQQDDKEDLDRLLQRVMELEKNDPFSEDEMRKKHPQFIGKLEGFLNWPRGARFLGAAALMKSGKLESLFHGLTATEIHTLLHELKDAKQCSVRQVAEKDHSEFASVLKGYCVQRLLVREKEKLHEQEAMNAALAIMKQKEKEDLVQQNNVLKEPSKPFDTKRALELLFTIPTKKREQVFPPNKFLSFLANKAEIAGFNDFNNNYPVVVRPDQSELLVANSCGYHPLSEKSISTLPLDINLEPERKLSKNSKSQQFLIDFNNKLVDVFE